jgi:DNA-binding GntR family transcriptional regulator
LRSQQALFQYWDTSFPQRNEAASEEHERILLALLAGDTERAAEAMAQHIHNARDRVLVDLFGVKDVGGDQTGLRSPEPIRTVETHG